MKTSQYIAEIPTKISGIPCLIGVEHFDEVEGSFSYNAASDWDYTGYTESEWVVLDRKGYKADWLAKKLENDDIAGIEDAIYSYMTRK
jgi:hypothetical protein